MASLATQIHWSMVNSIHAENAQVVSIQMEMRLEIQSAKVKEKIINVINKPISKERFSSTLVIAAMLEFVIYLK